MNLRHPWQPSCAHNLSVTPPSTFGFCLYFSSVLKFTLNILVYTLISQRNTHTRMHTSSEVVNPELLQAGTHLQSCTGFAI